jgi:hypothetical protein
MIDDAHRRAFDAETQAQDETARANAAAEGKDRLRADCSRLERELWITGAIASELFSALLAADPLLADRASQAILFQYGKYQVSQEFPNVRDLLERLASAR